MALALLVDFGSTFTKLTFIDLERARLLARTAIPTTFDITDGLERGLLQLEAAGFNPAEADVRLACSSAAGGLRVGAIGLVEDLTVEAARRAALGAGARVQDVFSGLLTEEEIVLLGRSAPDIVLLAGGTDGGNEEALVHNADQLARKAALRLPSRAWVEGDAPRLRDVPIVLAGNRDGVPRAADILRIAGFDVRTAANVMPRLGVIDVEPARDEIRRLFFERIVRAKGLDGAERFVEGVLMPTPAAVLAGARLLAEGTDQIPGWGDVLVVDVGGATTDVHSVGQGHLPEGTTRKGLPEPFVKRTVEGDLGLRVSAQSLLEAAGMGPVLKRANRRLTVVSLTETDVKSYVKRITLLPEYLPRTEKERAIDYALAATAVEQAAARHGGRMEERMTALGLRRFVTGKDLRTTACLIGTGGILVHGGVGDGLLQFARYSRERPDVLLPEAPRVFSDADYVLSACGLLAQRAPEAALKILHTHLRRYGMKETER